jgi:hypothetical protein
MQDILTLVSARLHTAHMREEVVLIVELVVVKTTGTHTLTIISKHILTLLIRKLLLCVFAMCFCHCGTSGEFLFVDADVQVFRRAHVLAVVEE